MVAARTTSLRALIFFFEGLGVEGSEAGGFWGLGVKGWGSGSVVKDVGVLFFVGCKDQ